MKCYQWNSFVPIEQVTEFRLFTWSKSAKIHHGDAGSRARPCLVLSCSQVWRMRHWQEVSCEMRRSWWDNKLSAPDCSSSRTEAERSLTNDSVPKNTSLKRCSKFPIVWMQMVRIIHGLLCFHTHITLHEKFFSLCKTEQSHKHKQDVVKTRKLLYYDQHQV